MNHRIVSFAAAASLAAIACGTVQKPLVATGPGTTPQRASSEPETPARDSAVAIRIEESIRKACGIQDSNAWFDFDSANLKQRNLPVLNAVAKCFSNGPLRGRTLLLVGRADPRGEFEYNMLLGDRRAYSVKSYVVERGLQSSNVATSSRGEMDATGTDETGWAEDRRVDVRLAD
ncbi:MAG: OmpA family protein [Polyangiaceae bacterium]